MAVKTLKLRRADACVVCETALDAGVTASWDSEAKAVTCIQCATPEAGPTPSPTPTIESGVAGQSAAREYDKRAMRERRRKEAAVQKDAEWRAEVTARRPVLGRVATVLTPKPTIGPESQSTKAWKIGAAGEQRVGEVLDACEGVLALHDRRIPRSKANIDHLAIGPTGIYVIDAKRYEGAVEKRDKGTWFTTDFRLYVGGRDRSKLLDGVEWQLEVVRMLLTDAGLSTPVKGILCFVDGMWPRFRRRPLEFGAVTALWPAALAEHVSAPGSLAEDEITRIANTLAAALRPA